MKFIMAIVFILSLQDVFASDSIFGRKLEVQEQVMLPSVIVRYSPTTIALGSEWSGFGEEHDADVFEIGIDGSYPIYSRLYFEGGLGGVIANVDDRLYGNSDAKGYGFYTELGLAHKTFFGQKKSYDIALRVGVTGLLSDLELTNESGNLEAVDEDDLSIFYIEPTIGINYNQFALLVGYKFLTNTVINKSMPTLALKYYF
ncbi:MAG: hypothetical protein WBF77_06470 [Sulfurimonadaceae bacterium]